VKKRNIKAITAFNVIQGHRGRYQSKARMRFPISMYVCMYIFISGITPIEQHT